mgnify:CR=1 FL=1|jgi:hypothetical protein
MREKQEIQNLIKKIEQEQSTEIKIQSIVKILKILLTKL